VETPEPWDRNLFSAFALALGVERGA